MPPRILVVDDEPDILELTRLALTQDGFEVDFEKMELRRGSISIRMFIRDCIPVVRSQEIDFRVV